MLAGIVNFFNPSLIVIGGGVAGAGDLLLATIRESVYRRSPAGDPRPRRQAVDLEGLGGVIGAAAMVTTSSSPHRLSQAGRGTPVGRRELAALR